METYPPATIKSVFSIEIHVAVVFDPNRCPLESRVDLPAHWLSDAAALQKALRLATGFASRDVFRYRSADTKIIRVLPVLRHRILCRFYEP